MSSLYGSVAIKLVGVLNKTYKYKAWYTLYVYNSHCILSVDNYRFKISSKTIEYMNDEFDVIIISATDSPEFVSIPYRAGRYLKRAAAHIDSYIRNGYF